MEAVDKSVPTHKVNCVTGKEKINTFTRMDDIQNNGTAVVTHGNLCNGTADMKQCNGGNNVVSNGVFVNGSSDSEQSNSTTDKVTNGAFLNGSPGTKQTMKLSEMPSFLQRSHIHIADTDRVKRIMHNIIQDGSKKLQIIADWDYTVTIGHIDGNKALSSWDVMEESKLLPHNNQERIKSINEIHMKAEFDHSMTPEDKMNDTIKWYRDIYDEIVKSKLQKGTVAQIVKDSGLKLRKKSEILFKKLQNLEIPTMVVSAGFGDFILEIIKLYNINMKYITVISNFFIYDKHNTIVGFTDPIYPFNKKEATVSETEYYKKFIDRSNAILIGDTVGDAKMDGGIIKNGNILKIGFLNGPERNPEYLKMFKQYFDIVVEDDQTMDTMIAIIDALKS